MDDDKIEMIYELSDAFAKLRESPIRTDAYLLAAERIQQIFRELVAGHPNYNRGTSKINSEYDYPEDDAPYGWSPPVVPYAALESCDQAIEELFWDFAEVDLRNPSFAMLEGNLDALCGHMDDLASCHPNYDLDAGRIALDDY